jgi:nucleotide-binding universal stress UspA family protein
MPSSPSPGTFRRIATALAFSPTAEALLAETIRLTQLFEAELILIHAGASTPEKEQYWLEWKRRFPSLVNAQIFWEPGKPDDVILQVSESAGVDLIVMGALHREKFWKRYWGSVGRSVPRKAKTSVLLLTAPNRNPVPFQKVVVNGVDHVKTKYTLQVAFDLAARDGLSELYVLKEIDAPMLSVGYSDGYDSEGMSQAKKELHNDELQSCKDLISSIPHAGVDVKTRVVFGHSGHAIANFSRSLGADLLIVNGPDRALQLVDRIFAHDLEFILENMPSNVLMVQPEMEL